MRIYIVVNLCVSSTLLSYISRLESRSKLPPGKERNGFRLAARRCDVKWGFSQTIDACRASVTLSKHCLCHYNGAWLAFVSFTLSKHWICNDKPLCTSVYHSQQALLLYIQMCSLRVCDSEQALLLDAQNQLASVSISLSKHWIWIAKSILPTVRHSLRGEYPQTPLSFNNSFTSKGEQQ